MKKIEEKNIIKYFKENGGYNVLSKYESFSSKLLIEKDGYKAKISYGHFKEGDRPNFFGDRCEYQLENIKLFIVRKNKNVEVLSCRSIRKGGKFRCLVKIKCSCGNIFETKWDNIFNGSNILCPKCSQLIGAKKRKKNYNKKYFEDIQSRGYSLINKNEKLYANHLVEVIQNKSGYRGFIYPNTNSEMLVFSWYHNKKNFIYNINKYNQNNGVSSEVIDLIDDNKSNYKSHEIVVKCECGEIFTTTYRSYLKGKFYCDKCSNLKSTYERKFENYLKEEKIDYVYQFYINSCCDIRPLPFDFQLKKYNILVEIDGEQHFYPVRFGGISEELSKKKFLSNQKRDKIKTEYCAKYNIPLLRITYNEMINDDFKEKLNIFIQNRYN